MRLYYPFKPFHITQAWGVLNPAYSQQFDDPSFKRHNGVDANLGKVAKEWPVYCPVESFRVSEVAFYPQGGGNQIGLTSKEKIQVGDKLCYVSILMCHAKKILVKVGDEPEVGELLMIANNTGFSTGPHTHIGMYRLNDKFQKIDKNEATGSYDPGLCWTGIHAVDVASAGTLFISGLRYYKYLIGL